jgi:hypothetical protein
MTSFRRNVMQLLSIIAVSLHVLAGVFWAGTTATLARVGGAHGEQLFRPQMGAALVAVLTGAYLWNLLHNASFGTAEQVLGAGILCAVMAAGVQGALGGRAVRILRNGGADQVGARSRLALAQRIAAALLTVTVVCMAVARYV